jgi:hypothetical protein
MCAACVELDYRSSNWKQPNLGHKHRILGHNRSVGTLEVVMVPQYPQNVAQNDRSAHVLDVGKLFWGHGYCLEHLMRRSESVSAQIAF